MADPATTLRQRQTNMPKLTEKDSRPLPAKPKRKPQGETTLQSILHLIPLLGLLGILYYLLNRNPSHSVSREDRVRELQSAYADKLGAGHWDFGDGRHADVGEVWREGCQGCFWVNTMLGNGGWVSISKIMYFGADYRPEPDLSGGMIPAVAPPFAMTRWTPQTRQNCTFSALGWE